MVRKVVEYLGLESRWIKEERIKFREGGMDLVFKLSVIFPKKKLRDFLLGVHLVNLFIVRSHLSTLNIFTLGVNSVNLIFNIC